MRFIWNFFFFGILFYLIWMFFPDAFLTLVSWADQIVAFLRDLIMRISEKLGYSPHKTTTALMLLPLSPLVKKLIMK